MWTRTVKAGLLRHNPDLILSDAFSSSEAIGLGISVMTKDQEIEVAKFALGPTCKVFTEDHKMDRRNSFYSVSGSHQHDHLNHVAEIDDGRLTFFASR
jgi:hypothetical protein